MDEIAQIHLIASKVRTLLEAYPLEKRPIGMQTFPQGACGDSSLILGSILYEMGFTSIKYICGTRGSHDDSTWRTHAWIRLDDLVIDITADQFEDVSDPVIVTKNSLWHNQFEIDDFNNRDFKHWYCQLNELNGVFGHVKYKILQEQVGEI
jgi:hypothetical protein